MVYLRAVTVALGLAVVGGQSLFDSEFAPLSRSSSYSSSSSTSWTRGKDGKMHQEVRHVTDEQASDGKERRHARAAVVCADGNCKEAVRQYNPKKVDDTVRMADVGLSSGHDIFEADFGNSGLGNMFRNNGFGSNGDSNVFGDGFGDSLGSGIERSMENDVANTFKSMQAATQGMGARTRGMHRQLEHAAAGKPLKTGDGHSDSTSLSRQYSYSNIDGQEQRSETDCQNGDCTTKVRTTHKQAKKAPSTHAEQPQQHAPEKTAPKEIIFVSP